MDERFSELKKYCTLFEPVGSRVTCDPAPTDTDEDFLLLAKPSARSVLLRKIEGDGYERGGSHFPAPVNRFPEDERFHSYKYEDVNLIVTESESFAKRFLAASSVAKRLNLLEKADRVALFQAVLYGVACEP